MAFPRAVLAAPAELPVAAFDAPPVVPGFALAGTDDDPEAAGVVAAAAFDGPTVAPGFALADAGDDNPEASEVDATPPVHIFM
jgi:hypothetical protein